MLPSSRFQESATSTGLDAGKAQKEGGDSMIVGVPRESFPGERRVALIPAVIPSYAKVGVEVLVETGAGLEAGYPDAQYIDKGAKIVATRAEEIGRAHV